MKGGVENLWATTRAEAAVRDWEARALRAVLRRQLLRSDRAEATRELDALDAALRRYREETERSLTSLARLTRESGAAGREEGIGETLQIRVQDFLERKKTVLDAWGAEADSLRGGFDALLGGGSRDGSSGSSGTYMYSGGGTGGGSEDIALDAAAVRLLSSEPDPSQYVLPEPLRAADLFEKVVLRFLSTGDIARAVAYTCSRWNRAARAESTWQHLVQRDLGEAVGPFRREGKCLWILFFLFPFSCSTCQHLTILPCCNSFSAIF